MIEINKYTSATLIELLLVIAITVILAASSAPFASSFILRNNLSTSTDKIIAAIHKTQNNAMSQKQYEQWGICINNGEVVIFAGDLASTCASNSFLEIFTIPSTVIVTGLSETTFNTLGEPSPDTGLATINISTSIDSNIVNVNPMGGIETN